MSASGPSGPLVLIPDNYIASKCCDLSLNLPIISLTTGSLLLDSIPVF